MRISLLLCLLLIPPAAAQETPPSPAGPVFPFLFPMPTGQNGYEEIVKAGDIAVATPAINEAMDAGYALTDKRRLMRQPQIMEALQLLRDGLAKPIRAPQGTDDAFKAFAGVRQLARLLSVEQYVLFADGKVGDAIQSARDTLRLGYAMQSQMLIGGLVGTAVDALAIRSLASRLDQLSARDCEALTKLANDWLAAPDPAIAALEAERQYALKQVYAVAGGNSGITPEVHALITTRIRQVQNLLRLEPWKRRALPPIEGPTVAAELVKNLGLDDVYMRALDTFTLELARVQMLGVHAAIRRYRWEHNRLPASLQELKLGRLGIDPSNGEPFTYRRSSDTQYTLQSVKVERF